MFPIARALIGADREGGTFVYPTLRQVKIGTILRGERDLRTYGDVIRSRSRQEWLDWVSAWRRPAIAETAYDGATGVSIIYSGLGQHFHDLVGHRRTISDWLRQNARLVGALDTTYDVAIHVRRGDFTAPTDNNNGHNVQQPLAWYKAGFEEACRLLEIQAPRVVLFTDSDPAEIARQLSVPDLSIDPSGNALSAILNMSKARCLVASRSSFSMWAAYLGDLPTIWPKMFDFEMTFPARKGLDYKL